MCGHGTIGVATVLVETGMVPVTEPETVVRLDTPAGLVEARVAVRDGRAESVTIENVPSFATRLDAVVDVPGLGPVRYDMAYGGNFYAILPVAGLGIAFDRAEKDRMLAAGLDIMAAINATDRPVHPVDPAISGCKHVQFTAPGVAGSDSRNARPSTPAGSTGRRAAPGPRPGWRSCTRGVRWTSASTTSTNRCWGPGSPGGWCAARGSATSTPSSRRSPAGPGSPARPSTCSIPPIRSRRVSSCERRPARRDRDFA
jgi:hypothetical protein